MRSAISGLVFLGKTFIEMNFNITKFDFFRQSDLQNFQNLFNLENFGFFGRVFYILFYLPLFIFYLISPSWLGGWGMRSASYICASITNVDPSFWVKNPMQCEEEISKHFQVWISPFFLILYLYILYRFICFFRDLTTHLFHFIKLYVVKTIENLSQKLKH